LHNATDFYAAYVDLASNKFPTTDTIDSLAGTTTIKVAIATLTARATRIFYPFSSISVGEISDGSSNTLLFAEKYLNPDNYETGVDAGDNDIAWVGSDDDTIRWTSPDTGNATIRVSGVPRRDTSGISFSGDFGSPHAGGFNSVFADGSVRQISYGIGATVYNNLANRKDGAALDVMDLQYGPLVYLFQVCGNVMFAWRAGVVSFERTSALYLPITVAGDDEFLHREP
jgi:prepilin-type processing-associated H-X9-DG protein